jgi:hypothetical protein
MLSCSSPSQAMCALILAQHMGWSHAIVGKCACTFKFAPVVSTDALPAAELMSIVQRMQSYLSVHCSQQRSTRAASLSKRSAALCRCSMRATA